MSTTEKVPPLMLRFIFKIPEILSKERSCNLKVEISNLNRKLITKEKHCEIYVC